MCHFEFSDDIVTVLQNDVSTSSDTDDVDEPALESDSDFPLVLSSDQASASTDTEDSDALQSGRS